jgi:hypothetical protein
VTSSVECPDHQHYPTQSEPPSSAQLPPIHTHRTKPRCSGGLNEA